MLARWREGGSRRDRRPFAWPRWIQARREDRGQHAAARAEVRAHAPIRPGERLLAVARSAHGGVVAATDWALYQQIGEAWVRLGWEHLNNADWDAQRHVLVLTGLTPEVPAWTVLHLSRDWGLPALAFERVSWAKVVDQRVSLGGAGARVIARRHRGEAPTWVVILDHGLDPADRGIRAGLQSAISELRRVTGVEVTAGPEFR